MKEKPISADELAAEARTVIHEFFMNKARTSADVAAARVASSVLATDARAKQASGAADALNFMIARELATDKTQLEQFLRAAMPAAPIVKSLPTRTTES